jgi:SNF2 family DNA or RNA helicase
MLESLLAEGRRIIVFSQFVEMLKLIRAEVQSRAWRHQWLDGATTHREEVVEAFQSGEAEIFLISLKAGGAGITLTAADTVILYDPWWNPQAERQAMDRVHRIGQNKPVFVYRLVTEGTVEQAIHQLQSKKQALADALFEGGSTKGAGLSSDDIDLLFRPAPAPQPQSSVLQGASSI